LPRRCSSSSSASSSLRSRRIGGIVCIAASNAGDTAQDLKTGYLIGATPWKQQLALMFGVVICVFSIGFTLNLMNTGLQVFQRLPKPIPFTIAAGAEGVVNGVQTKGFFPNASIQLTPRDHSAAKETLPNANHLILLNAIGSTTLEDGKYLYNPETKQIEIQWIQGIGSEKAAAPQGRLMATVINGILTQKLPWGLVLLGVALVIVVELLGIRSLTFAVGAYLSIATTLAIFVGGVMRWMVDRAMLHHAAKLAATNPDVIDPETGLPVPTSVTPALDTESEISPGSLYASGLIAAGGIVGLLGVGIRAGEGISEQRGGNWQFWRFSSQNPVYHDWVSVVMFGMLAFSLYYFARKPLDTGSR
jgi:uncharacterized oligopeptide transporter (OPT) family protein